MSKYQLSVFYAKPDTTVGLSLCVEPNWTVRRLKQELRIHHDPSLPPPEQQLLTLRKDIKSRETLELHNDDITLDALGITRRSFINVKQMPSVNVLDRSLEQLATGRKRKLKTNIFYDPNSHAIKNEGDLNTDEFTTTAKTRRFGLIFFYFANNASY